MNNLYIGQPVVLVHGLDNYFNGQITAINKELVEVTTSDGKTHPFKVGSNRRQWQSYNIHFRTDIDRFLEEQNDLSKRFGEDEWMENDDNNFVQLPFSFNHQRYINTFQDDAFGQDLI